MCECCEQMVRGVDGEFGLSRLLSQPCPQSSTPERMFSRVLSLGPRKHVVAVKAGEGLDSWGILEQGRCNSCRSNPCPHTAVRRPQQERLTADVFEQRFLAEWDLTAGTRKLTCMSRAKLAEKIESSPQLLGIYTRVSWPPYMKPLIYNLFCLVSVRPSALQFDLRWVLHDPDCVLLHHMRCMWGSYLVKSLTF